MWKTTFILGIILSLGANADICNINNIEGVISLLKQSPQEKHYKDVNDNLLELKYEQEIRRGQPEFSASMNFDKDNFKNNELTAELLINIDDYLNYSYRKQISGVVKILSFIKTIMKDYLRLQFHYLKFLRTNFCMKK